MNFDLQYAGPDLIRSRPVFYKIAMGCGLFPLISLCGILLLWLLFGGQGLMAAGFILIPIGLPDIYLTEC